MTVDPRLSHPSDDPLNATVMKRTYMFREQGLGPRPAVSDLGTHAAVV